MSSRQQHPTRTSPSPGPLELALSMAARVPVTVKGGCVTLPVSAAQAQVSLAVKAVSLQWPTGLMISRQPLLCTSGPTFLPQGLCTFAPSACSAPLPVFYGEVPTVPPPGSRSNAALQEDLPGPGAGQPWRSPVPPAPHFSPCHLSSSDALWLCVSVCLSPSL